MKPICMILNFEKFNLPKGVSGKELIPVDIRESFADAVYNRCDGIRAHTLAHKIFASSGETDYDEAEMTIINEVAQTCRPSVIDGLNLQINNQTNN